MAEHNEAWQVGELRFPVHTGEVVRVAAWINGRWALDLRPFLMDDQTTISPGWALTHIPTGRMAAGILESLENAQGIVSLIDALGDWDFTDPVHVMPMGPKMRELRDSMADIVVMRQALFGPAFFFERKANG